MTCYRVSKVYRVPKQTLLDKIKYKYSKDCPGSPAVLRTEEESPIVKWVFFFLAEISFPVTNNQLVSCVTDLVKELNRPNSLKIIYRARSGCKSFSKEIPKCVNVFRNA